MAKQERGDKIKDAVEENITKEEGTTNPVGRPQTFSPDQIEQIRIDFEKYIEENEDPTIVGFTHKHAPIYSETLGRYSRINKDYISDHEEFSELRKRAIEKQEDYLLQGVTKNKLNATMGVFRLKQPQHGYRDKSEVENTGKIDIGMADFIASLGGDKPSLLGDNNDR